jgi:predicted GNAT superfamily acetyltransferase
MTDVAERSAHQSVTDTRSDGIVIRDCATLEEYLECVAIQEETWGRGFSERVPAAILRVSQRVGGVTAAAFDARGRMLGFVFGMTGVQGRDLVHWSDMLAVRADARGRHIGERLKQYQREQVCALGVRTIMWTFDPLVSRNAHFNLNRLGAMPVEYAVNLYGTTRSALHGALPTDRLIVAWDCAPGAAVASAARDTGPGSADAPMLNPVSNDTPTLAEIDSVPTLRLQIPVDIQPILQQQPALATRWREIIRRAFVERMAAGYRVNGFVRPAGGDAGAGATLPYYVLTRATR